MDEIVLEFLTEAEEQIAVFGSELARLGENPGATEPLADAYRSLHTVKGAAGFLGFSQLEALTAAGELLLSRVQRGQLELGSERLEALGEAAAAIRRILGRVRTDGVEDGVDDSALLDRLGLLATP